MESIAELENKRKISHNKILEWDEDIKLASRKLKTLQESKQAEVKTLNSINKRIFDSLNMFNDGSNNIGADLLLDHFELHGVTAKMVEALINHKVHRYYGSNERITAHYGGAGNYKLLIVQRTGSNTKHFKRGDTLFCIAANSNRDFHVISKSLNVTGTTYSYLSNNYKVIKEFKNMSELKKHYKLS